MRKWSESSIELVTRAIVVVAATALVFGALVQAPYPIVLAAVVLFLRVVLGPLVLPWHHYRE